jgi:mannose-6-phosphate isomerase-like protein (cupin superfamily)
LEYVRAVDFGAFRPREFHGQVLADATSGVDSCVLMCTRLPVGIGSIADLHVHVSDQFLFVLQGRMNIQIGARTYIAEPNDLIFIPAGAPHWSWNTGEEDELHAEVIVPPPSAGHPILYQVSAPTLPSSGIAASTAESAHHIRALDESRLNSHGISRVTLADRTTGSRACRFGAIQVPPSDGGRARQAHVFDEFFYVLSGRIELEIDGKKHEAGPNSYVLLPAGTLHAQWNTGTEPCRYLSIVVPKNEETEPIDAC